MNEANWISLTGVIVALIGVVVTGIFSYWIMRYTKLAAVATKESANASRESASAAEASFKLSKQMMEMQEKKEAEAQKKLREMYHKIVLKNAEQVLNALLLQNINIKTNKASLKPDKLKEVPKYCGINEEQLSMYFSEQEVRFIETAWLSFKQYLGKYWPDGFDKISDMLPYQQLEAAARSDNPRTNFYDLINLLKSEEL